MDFSQYSLSLSTKKTPRLTSGNLDQICHQNQIPEHRIVFLLAQIQNLPPLQHEQEFWSNHPFGSEVFLYLEHHTDYHLYNSQSQRTLIFPEVECSDDDDYDPSDDPSDPEPYPYPDSEEYDDSDHAHEYEY